MAPVLPSAGILPALAGIPHVLPETSVQSQPVPLLTTASSTTASALTPPIIHVEPQTSELAYDASSLQGFAPSSPDPDIDSIKTPSLSDSEDNDSVVITPLTASPSPPAVPSPTSFEIPTVSPQPLDNTVLPSVVQSRLLDPLALPPSRQTLAPLSLPGHLPQQAPPIRITQNGSAISEITQDDNEYGTYKTAYTNYLIIPMFCSVS